MLNPPNHAHGDNLRQDRNLCNRQRRLDSPDQLSYLVAPYRLLPPSHHAERHFSCPIDVKASGSHQPSVRKARQMSFPQQGESSP